MRTALITHPNFLKHDTGPGHLERPDRVRAIMDAIEASDLTDGLERVTPEPVDDDLLQTVHTRDYIRQVRMLAAEEGGMLDPDTVVSETSYDVALLAAGGAVGAVEAVMQGRVQRAFALVRPPGHHALAGRGMGFCLFNNAACAAVAARQQFGLSRICILDWDVHHGNGTQAIFYRDRSVLVISLHQEYWYPGTGDWEETGEGEGLGFTVNIPLPTETGDEGYRVIFEEIVIPMLEVSAPELMIISAGYDAHYGDPLGGMLLTAPGFRSLAEMVLQASGHPGRVVGVLEGGYDLTYLGNSVLATLEAFTGRPPRVDDRPPKLPEVSYHTIQARARKARGIARNYWNI